MAKVVSVRERVHQPFWDSLIRTAGMSPGSVTDKTSLFTGNGARTEDRTNLQNGSTLPSDQSHVVLALRVFAWFRNPILRTAGGAAGEVAITGDYSSLAPFQAGATFAGSAPAQVTDIYRLAHQCEEQLHWDFGTGLKNSIFNMPTWYFPAGGGLTGQLGGQTDLIHFQNGDASHSSILRLARAILIPPRQNIITNGNIHALPDGGNSQLFGTAQGSRNMLSFKDNLNAVDLAPKVVQFIFDGLFSRDVQ
jgi:hypothetical protein